MKYNTVFLDFDDTLIDTQGYATKCLEALYTEHNLHKYFSSADTFIDIYHKNIGKIWEAYALGEIDKQALINTRFDSTFEDFIDVDPHFLKSLSDDFVERVVKNDLYIDGAKEVLEYLKPRYQVVMLSNGFSEMQYDKLKNVGFTNYFDDVILSDVLGVNKPHPDIFTFALKKQRTTAEKSIMIGDNYLADIKGAMNSNIDQIWYNPNGLKADTEPTYTISRLIEIKEIL